MLQRGMGVQSTRERVPQTCVMSFLQFFLGFVGGKPFLEMQKLIMSLVLLHDGWVNMDCRTELVNKGAG